MAAMKLAACLLALAIFLDQPTGCDQHPKPEAPTAKHYPPVHRFINVPGSFNATDVALDTVTGQLCRTWVWQYRSDKDPNAGGLDTLPTCLSIFQSFPASDQENTRAGTE